MLFRGIMNKDREIWLKMRTEGLGGSDASVVLGINPYKSRLELWNEKVTGVVNEKETLDTKWGKILENVIIEEYQKESGMFTFKPEIMFRSSQYPFMIANIDSIIIDGNKVNVLDLLKNYNETILKMTNDTERCGILEVKTKGAFTDWSKYEDEKSVSVSAGVSVPIYYMTQMQHYLCVMRYKWGQFAIFDMGKKDLLIVDVKRDEEMINMLIEEEGKFWDMVVRKIKPEVESSVACNEFLRKYYPESIEGKVVDLRGNSDAEKWAKDLKYIKEQLDIFKKLEIEAKNWLMSYVGDAEKAIGEGYNITWKSPRDKEVFDIEKFKKENLELWKRYVSVEKQTRRFGVRFGKIGGDKI